MWPSLRWADFAENLREFARRIDEVQERSQSVSGG